MAIAFDAATDGGNTATPSPYTMSHTVVSSTNGILFVGLYGDITSDLLTGITYNGVAMTFIGKRRATLARWVYLYYLLSPAVGAHTVSAAFSAPPDNARAIAVSYTGAAQSGQPDSSATNSADAAASLTCTTTVVVANSWTVMVARAPGVGIPTAGAGSHLVLADSNGLIVVDSNAGVATGAQSLVTSAQVGVGNWSGVIASFAPAGAIPIQWWPDYPASARRRTPGHTASGMTPPD